LGIRSISAPYFSLVILVLKLLLQKLDGTFQLPLFRLKLLSTLDEPLILFFEMVGNFLCPCPFFESRIEVCPQALREIIPPK
jgi:hypothetical protein